jgi:hypothetical protein
MVVPRMREVSDDCNVKTVNSLNCRMGLISRLVDDVLAVYSVSPKHILRRCVQHQGHPHLFCKR